MKKYLFFLIFLIVSLKGIAGGYVGDFYVMNEHLKDDRVQINASGITNIRISVSITRDLQGPGWIWYPVDMQVGLGYFEGGYHFFEGSMRILSSSFGQYEFFKTVEITSKVDVSKLSAGSKIMLFYKDNLVPNPPTNYLPVDYEFDKVPVVVDPNPPTTPSPVYAPNPFLNRLYDLGRSSSRIIPAYSLEGSGAVWAPSATPILTVGQDIYTPNGAYLITLQTDGDIMLYRTSNWQKLWASNSAGKGGRYLYFQADGNLVLYKNSNYTGVVWSSGIYQPASPSVTNARFVFQNDGNLVMVYNGGNYIDIMGDTDTNNKVSSHWGRI